MTPSHHTLSLLGDHLVYTVGVGHYLMLSALLGYVGLLGLVIQRKSLIHILICLELILLAANINFVAFSAYYQDLGGQVWSLFVLAVAAAEAAIGLAILIVYFRAHGTLLTGAEPSLGAEALGSSTEKGLDVV